MDNKKIIFDFARFPFCYRTFGNKKNNFTNKLKDEKEFYSKFKTIQEDLLPHICGMTFEQVQNDRHSHPIYQTEKEKIALIKFVVANLVEAWRPGIDVGEFIKQNIEGEMLWQLGNKGVRIYGIRRENIFEVLFIDYHHLIYPSIKFNDRNYNTFNFGVIEYAEVENG